MFRTFIQTLEFSRKWDDLGLNDDDLRLLELDIINNLDKYPRIRGTGGLQKARMSLENKGKSGGARVCFADFAFAETTYLITIYGKKKKIIFQKRKETQLRKQWIF